MKAEKKRILEEPTEIIAFIRSTPETVRHRTMPDESLSEIRGLVERFILQESSGTCKCQGDAKGLDGAVVISGRLQML